jgi:hypothetical protein
VIQLTDYYVPYLGSGVADTFLLPAAALYAGTSQQTYIFKNVGTGNVSLIAEGADTIELIYNSLPIGPGSNVQVVSDGISNWELI